MTQEELDIHWNLNIDKLPPTITENMSKPQLNSGYAHAIITSNFLEGKKSIGDATEEEIAIIRTQIPTTKAKL